MSITSSTPLKIDRIVLRRLSMPLRHSFTTSFATFTQKVFTVVEVWSEGLVGYGECAATEFPLYNEEYAKGAYDVIRNILIPILKKEKNIIHPSDINRIFSPIRRNYMARASIDEAIWDLWSKREGISLAKALGGTRRQVETGISIGIQKSPDELVKIVKNSLELGYKRIKIKISPGKDLAYIARIRSEFPDILLQVDANSAYSLDNLNLLKQLDQCDLLLIEQPLAHDDIVDHRFLQSQLKTPICLDESIDSVEDARKALELQSCRIINIKVARVGGLTEALKIHNLCATHGVGIWCGGMLDAGIAKAHNIAIASLPNFIYPGDIPPSDRNFEEDIIEPLPQLGSDSTIVVPEGPGIGFEINKKNYNKFTLDSEAISFS
ncbi:MAG: o-succinylbenzoate synthase [Burkholderiaceae bacterium]|nr:o-succinylbenzoate synthase [Burkholderiaceae bacterium]